MPEWAIDVNPDDMSDLVSTIAGAVSPTEFLGAQNVGRIMARAGAATRR